MISDLAVTDTIAGNGPTTTNQLASPLANLNISGAGSVVLAAANTYGGGTTITSGITYANGGVVGTSSATGTGSVLVATGGTLGGNGTIKPTGGAGITIQSGGSLSSGGVQVSNASQTTVTPNSSTGHNGLTLDNTEASSSLLAVNGGANLTFSLGSGTTTNSGALTFDTPNTNSTYLTLTGNTIDQIFSNTTTADSVTLVDLTAFSTDPALTLQLTLRNPYLLIATSLTNNADFANLWTTGGEGANGYVLGVSDGTAFGYTPFVLSATDINGGALTVPYDNLQLYLYDGRLEVVPEPGTWALMVGGLALLVVIQLRRSKRS